MSIIDSIFLILQSGRDQPYKFWGDIYKSFYKAFAYEDYKGLTRDVIVIYFIVNPCQVSLTYCKNEKF